MIELIRCDCDDQQALSTGQWRRYLAERPGGCPLDVPITGRIDGEPWTEAIAFDRASLMARHLVTACFVVIAYLTGMRSSEVPALEAGCCPDPGEGDGRSLQARRHLIRSRQFKTARDDDGNHLSAGVMGEAPWVAVPQVVAVIRILERLADPAGLLFPTDRGTRPGRSLAFSTMGTRIEELIGWVNERTASPGREETIPADPHGHIGTSRFRRTLAWHIARRPGGLVALAVQYGHLRALVSQGYGSRQRRHPPAPGPGNRPLGRRAPHRGPRRPAARRRGLRPGGPPSDPRRPRGAPPLRRNGRHAPAGQGPAIRPGADRVRERRLLPDLQLRPKTSTLQPGQRHGRHGGHAEPGPLPGHLPEHRPHRQPRPAAPRAGRTSPRPKRTRR